MDLFAKVVLHPCVSKDRRAHDRGVDCVGTASDVSKVVSLPVRKRPERVSGSSLSSVSTCQQMCTSKAKYEDSDRPRSHDVDPVRDVHYVRHERDDPGCHVPMDS